MVPFAQHLNHIMIKVARTFRGCNTTCVEVGSRQPPWFRYLGLARFKYLHGQKMPLVCILHRNPHGGGILKRRAKAETVSLRAIIYGTLRSSERQKVESKDLFLMTSSRVRTDQYRLALGT